MTAVERMYRSILLQERLAVIQSEIAVVAETLWSSSAERELGALNHAERALDIAVNALKEAERESRKECQPELIESQLKASIELINTSPERLRRIRRAGLAKETP